MKPLFLTPLPSAPSENETHSYLRAGEDFVEEAVVHAVMARQNLQLRRSPNLKDLALAADDLNFAGWQILEPIAAPFPSSRIQQSLPANSPAGFPLQSEIPSRSIGRFSPYSSWISRFGALVAIGLGAWLMLEPSASSYQSFKGLMENLVQLPFGLSDDLPAMVD